MSKEAKEKLEQLIRALASKLSPEDKKELLESNAKRVTALKLDNRAPPNLQMVSVIMRIVQDMLENIEGAETGDAINALMNSMANFFLKNALPGKERAGRESIVKELAAGLDHIIAEADVFYAMHPDYMTKFHKLIATVEDEKNDEKVRNDAIEELKDMKDKRTKHLMRKDQGYAVCNEEGTMISRGTEDEIDLDYDAATHKTVGHA